MAGYIGISSAENARSSSFWSNFLQLKLPPLVTAPEVAMGACIAENRNKITQRALELKADWIFYVDDDQLFNPDTLNNLLKRNVDVVSALYLSREYPYEPLAFDEIDPDGGKGAFRTILNSCKTSSGLLNVVAVGVGALLVRKRVLEKLKFPYWTLGQVHPSGWGDDLDFCYRVKEAGFDIYCDLDEKVGHIVQGSIWPEYTKENKWSTKFVSGNTYIARVAQVTSIEEIVKGVNDGFK